MKKYIYRDARFAVIKAGGPEGLDVFSCIANNITEADVLFSLSGLTFNVGKKTLSASIGVEKLAFISCRWEES